MANDSDDHALDVAASEELLDSELDSGVAENGATADAGDAPSSSFPDLPQDLVRDPSLDVMSQSAPTGFDDPLAELEYFTRKEIMKMAFETASRFYQSAALKDGDIIDLGEGQLVFKNMLNHTVSGLALCLNDDVMSQAFAQAYDTLAHNEDPWVLAIQREMRRIEQSQGMGPGRII